MSDYLARAIARTFPHCAGDCPLTAYDLLAIPPAPSWEGENFAKWGLRVQPGISPTALVIAGRVISPPLMLAFFQSIVEANRQYVRTQPFWNNHLRAHLWVEEDDLIVQYAQAIDFSKFRAFDLMAPFYPAECTLAGELVVVGTDATRWLGEGVALCQDEHGRNPETIVELLAAAMEALFFFEVDEPPPPVPVVGAISNGRQAVII